MGGIGPLPSQEPLYKIVCTVVCGGVGGLSPLLFSMGLFSVVEQSQAWFHGGSWAALSAVTVLFSVWEGDHSAHLDRNAGGTGTWRSRGVQARGFSCSFFFWVCVWRSWGVQGSLLPQDSWHDSPGQPEAQMGSISCLRSSRESLSLTDGCSFLINYASQACLTSYHIT